MRHRQGGAAALEFAFVAPIMILLLWGLVSFGSIFFAHMTLSSAAAEGARAAARTGDSALAMQSVEGALRSSGISSTGGADFTITVSEASCPGGDCLVVRIEAPYDKLEGTPVLRAITLPLVGSMSWLPETLVAEASALR